MNHMRHKTRQMLVVLLCLLMTFPFVSYASDGKKHFKLAIQFENNKQWDKAAEQFALAAAEAPSNVEYSLHLQRALVNAAIMLEGRGDMLAKQKDYNAAYQSYRQAYSYDPTNEETIVKMKRMLDAQGITLGTPKKGAPGNALETGFSEGADLETAEQHKDDPILDSQVASRYVERRYPAQDIVYRPMSLMAAISQLAQSMRLNVVFDSVTDQMLQRQTNYSVELHDVTPARALEIMLETNNLMYSPVDTRTIVVANDNPQSRMKYEQQSVRTFYLQNADLNEVRTALTTTIGTKQVVPFKQLNALVVRDTPANLSLADAIIKSLDKSKAEVLIDINLYEVSQNDLMQIGNQFNTGDLAGNSAKQLSLGFLGGIGQQSSIVGTAARTLTGPFGIGVGLPSSFLSFLQSKGKSKLLASTQVHVLDGEQHQIRIGQRVPIQTASIPYYGITPTTTGTTPGTTTGTTTPTTSPDSLLSSAFGGYPQIQYENVGLNIDMTPTVMSDDVQMKMKIESSSIDGSTSTLTPTFNQRQMQSVARIRDGQTTMIAGISQTNKSTNVKGIPIIGLIPILGRFFSTPNTTDTQSDIVITVTPHILRSADITKYDHLTHDVGPESNPRRQLTIEQILYIADHAGSDQQPNIAGDKEGPAKLASSPATATTPAQQSPTRFVPPAQGAISTSGASPGVVVMPVQDTSKSATRPASNNTSQPPNPPPAANKSTPAKSSADSDDDDDDDDDQNNNQPVQMIVRASPVAVMGQQYVAAVIVSGNATITSATVGLTYDPNMFEFKGVRDGGMMSSGGIQIEPQFSGGDGVVNIQLARPPGSPGVPARGQLLYAMFDVKAKGNSAITLAEQTTLMAANGQVVPVKMVPAQVQVK